MKRNSKKNKKIRKLVLVCALCAIVLTVATYTWFIGMQTVNVSSFDVEIAATKGLYLSMDGENWSYTLDARGAEAYAANTNTWAEKGLKPVSTIGSMDSDVSRMIMYEKASLTATRGGYRLLSSRVNNFHVGEDQIVEQGQGYVAFDLFIKNMSGDEYYTEYNPLNEEAIYLTPNSAVTVSENGGAANTGIENSVRVAFAQIGRVKSDSAVANITGITCKDDTATGVTGICETRQIWEPNDTKHETNAVNWYQKACYARKADGTNVNLVESYEYGEDGTVENGAVKCNVLPATNVATYAISREIAIADNVDVYDGAEYNTYTADTATFANYQAAIKDKTGEQLTTAQAGFKLVSYPYFTDTMKVLKGNTRPTFMTLAPNSVTKVRVYVYLEGQDVDNYDFASLGKKISVNFGFTKERYNGEDIDYNGPDIDTALEAEREAEFPTNPEPGV